MTQGLEPDVVWWSDTGAVLHKDPNCPPFVRARVRAILAMRRGDWPRGIRIRTFDFRDQGGIDAVYPPERMALCRLCDRTPA